MESINEEIKKLEKESMRREKKAAKTGKNTEREKGYQEALMDIALWIDANKREVETATGYIFDMVNAD